MTEDRIKGIWVQQNETIEPKRAASLLYGLQVATTVIRKKPAKIKDQTENLKPSKTIRNERGKYNILGFQLCESKILYLKI